MTPDVNVLVAASRSDHPHHTPARNWLEQSLDQAGERNSLALQPMVTASFMRLVTHPKIFKSPTPQQDAIAFLEALMDSPGTHVPELGSEWTELRRLVLEKGLAANDLPDAWLAAAVTHQGEHLVTFDRDFKRLLSRSQVTFLTAA